MSIDNISQTSDYSTSSEATNLCQYRCKSQQIIRLTRDEELRKHEEASIKINNKTIDYYCSNCCHPYRTDGISSQVKALAFENTSLKRDVQFLQTKCQKIEDFEKQFYNLQHRYEDYLKTSANRKAIEHTLNLKLEAKLRQVEMSKLKMSNSQYKATSSSTQTPNYTSSLNKSSDDRLLQENSALKLMLREKEELILSLLSERTYMKTGFSPVQCVNEDYIVSNEVSL